MKNLTYIALFLFSLNIFSQDIADDYVDTDINSANVFEIKTNALYLVFGIADLSVEYSFNENSAIGISGSLPFAEEVQESIEYLVSPYYRYYFGQKQTAGFFLEGFGLLNSIERDFFDIFDSEERYVTDFALGIGLGGKWVTDGGFIGEVNFGLGRNILKSDEHDFKLISKFGITVGYRF